VWYQSGLEATIARGSVAVSVMCDRTVAPSLDCLRYMGEGYS
jgi:hypothetical protein